MVIHGLFCQFVAERSLIYMRHRNGPYSPNLLCIVRVHTESNSRSIGWENDVRSEWRKQRPDLTVWSIHDGT